MIIADTMQEDNNDFELPEPTPIRPDGAIEVVPYLTLSHVDDNWKKLENFKELFRISRDETIGCLSFLEPLPVRSSNSIRRESFSNHFMRESLNVGSGGCYDAETVSTSTDTMSLSSSTHSSQSIIERSSKSSPCRKKQVTPNRQNFQEYQWEDKFIELTGFQQRYGHLNVPYDDSNQQVSDKK
jgi:hypothetical protein